MTKRLARAAAVVVVAGLASATLTREDIDRETALAYSAGQQLITTAWSVGLAIVMVAIVFGWAGGKSLVASSYDEAKARAPSRRRRADT